MKTKEQIRNVAKVLLCFFKTIENILRERPDLTYEELEQKSAVCSDSVHADKEISDTIHNLVKSTKKYFDELKKNPTKYLTTIKNRLNYICSLNDVEVFQSRPPEPYISGKWKCYGKYIVAQAIDLDKLIFTDFYDVENINTGKRNLETPVSTMGEIDYVFESILSNHWVTVNKSEQIEFEKRLTNQGFQIDDIGKHILESDNGDYKIRHKNIFWYLRYLLSDYSFAVHQQKKSIRLHDTLSQAEFDRLSEIIYGMQ